MQKTLEKFFTNDGLFLVTTLICVISNVISVLYGSTFDFDAYMLQQYVWIILECACIFGLYVSYIKHAKNIMKCLMGALLMELILDATYELGFSIFGNVYFCLMLALAINHIVINGDHYASNGKVYINQIIALLLIANYTIWCISDIKYCVEDFDIYFLLIDWLCFGSTIVSILYIESRLDKFRNERQDAGWTAEKGYPEDYDRKKNYGK